MKEIKGKMKMLLKKKVHTNVSLYQNLEAFGRK